MIVDTYSLQKSADNWNPEFEYVDDIKEASNLINISHEDYPLFCSKTEESIIKAIDILREGIIKEFDIKSLHGFCMKDKEYIKTGTYRTNNGVIVGNHIPPDIIYLPQLMMSICPVDKDIVDIEMWYRLFECIHPFEDGNGRIGAIILAAVSFIQDNSYKVPKRINKETLREAETKHIFKDGCLYKLKQPAIVLEKSIIHNTINVKNDYFNQTSGIMCRESSFEGFLYILPYQLIDKKPFNSKWWYDLNHSELIINDQYEEFIEGTIKKIEKLIVKYTEIQSIIINRDSFIEASAYCEVVINNVKQNAWLTWENCD